MAIDLATPGVEQLGAVVATLAAWQDDAAPLQLHPGDLGWFQRFGAPATAAALRTWTDDGRIVAIGLLDGATVLRLAVEPARQDDDALARAVASDLVDPGRAVLPTGAVAVATPAGARVRQELGVAGWQQGEAWQPLQRSLDETVEVPASVRIEIVGAERAHLRTAVQRASFARSSFTDDLWRMMASGPAYRQGCCLLAFDTADRPVAAATVWSAGTGRPGLIEPLGVDPARRGHGHGTAITLACAAVLRRLGSSSAQVCTPSANTGGIATYRAAGFEPLPELPDLTRTE